ncbi:MAG: extracellular solute-binding protein [Eubacteriales bacterium]|nr:extracellular solute-binding protein [Eubacteriales bacterium]
MEVSKVAPFAGDGALLNLAPYIEAENYDLSDFYEGLMSFSYGEDGGVYSMPFNRSTFILYYNADLFAEKGLAVPTTWSELKDVAMAVTDPANKMWGLTAPEQGIYLELWVMQLGGEVLNADQSDIGYNNEIGLAAAQYLRDAVDDGWYQAASGQEFVSNENVRTAFINKNVAMLYSSSGDIKTLQNSCEFTVGTAILPAADGRTPASTTGGANIAALDGHPEEENAATWDFIKYLLSTESTSSFAQSTGYLPVRKSVLTSDSWTAFVAENPAFATPAQMLQYCVGRPYNYNYTTFYYTYENNALAKVVSSAADRAELQTILNELSEAAKATFAG